MLSTLLIIITLGHADAPHVAFSPAESPEACAAKAESVTAVLTKAGYEIGAQRCVQTDLALAAYDHAQKDFTHAFRVTLPADATKGGTVEPMAKLSDCTPTTDADPAVWCVLSAQGVATN